ncbi:hypothetical protein SNEBB_006075 [Seison nebaliae]|nr:hypothetical protein SNEBB_006075 [Seison nebaliae]
MSKIFSAQQFDDAYVNRQSQSCELIDKNTKQIPKRRNGRTVPISNDSGHILEAKSCDKKSTPFGNYIGTWDLPKKIIISPHKLNGMARNDEHLHHLKNQQNNFCNHIENKLKEKQIDGEKIANRQKNEQSLEDTYFEDSQTNQFF